MLFLPIGGQEPDRDADQQDDQQERQFVMLDVFQENLQDPTEEISPRGDDGRSEGRADQIQQDEPPDPDRAVHHQDQGRDDAHAVDEPESQHDPVVVAPHRQVHLFRATPPGGMSVQDGRAFAPSQKDFLRALRSLSSSKGTSGRT